MAKRYKTETVQPRINPTAMSGTASVKKIVYISLIVSIVIVGTILRCDHFFNKVDGQHIFRQAHVASNILYYLKNGISVTGEMFAKNQTYKVFDFPLYQMVSAVISQVITVDPVYVSRGVNILIYVLTSLVLVRIMQITGVSSSVTIITLLLFTMAPLNVFYNRAIIPDNLAVLFAFMSLYYFLQYDSNKRLFFYLAMLLTGVIATLMKNPIYLPVFLSIVYYLLLRHGIRKLLDRDFLAFAGLLLIVVVLFKLYSNFVNTGLFHTPSSEYYWYFSNLQDRSNPNLYITIITRIFTEIINPFWGVFCVSGIIYYAIRQVKIYAPDIFLGLLWGSILTILVFFNLHWIHHYYLLPFVFIVCYFTACSLEHLYLTLVSGVAKYWMRKAVASAAVVVLLGITFVGYARYRIPADEDKYLVQQALFIKNHTPPDSFIFYLALDKENWNPEFLYFAEREGYNLGLDSFGTKKINQVIYTRTVKYSEYYLFVVPYIYRERKQLFSTPNLQLVREDVGGILYRITMSKDVKSPGL